MSTDKCNYPECTNAPVIIPQLTIYKPPKAYLCQEHFHLYRFIGTVSAMQYIDMDPRERWGKP